MESIQVNILGTEYTIETHKISEDSFMKKVTLKVGVEKMQNLLQ